MRLASGTADLRDQRVAPLVIAVCNKYGCTLKREQASRGVTHTS
jgi:hypothetical protein